MTTTTVRLDPDLLHQRTPPGENRTDWDRRQEFMVATFGGDQYIESEGSRFRHGNVNKDPRYVRTDNNLYFIEPECFWQPVAPEAGCEGAA